jgi:hypothetical protein
MSDNGTSISKLRSHTHTEEILGKLSVSGFRILISPSADIIGG